MLTPSTLKGNVRGGANFKEGVVAYYDGEFSEWRSTLYSQKTKQYLENRMHIAKEELYESENQLTNFRTKYLLNLDSMIIQVLQHLLH